MSERERLSIPADTLDALLSERDSLAAALTETQQALRGWESRDNGAFDLPCNIERGTFQTHDLEILVEGLSEGQAERIETFLTNAYERAVALADVSGTEPPGASA